MSFSRPRAAIESRRGIPILPSRAHLPGRLRQPVRRRSESLTRRPWRSCHARAPRHHSHGWSAWHWPVLHVTIRIPHRLSQRRGGRGDAAGPGRRGPARRAHLHHAAGTRCGGPHRALLLNRAPGVIGVPAAPARAPPQHTGGCRAFSEIRNVNLSQYDALGADNDPYSLMKSADYQTIAPIAARHSELAQ